MNLKSPFVLFLNATIINNIPVTILNFPIEKWKKRKGWINKWKNEYVYQFMSQPHIRDDDVIQFFDAKDVFFF